MDKIEEYYLREIEALERIGRELEKLNDRIDNDRWTPILTKGE